MESMQGSPPPMRPPPPRPKSNTWKWVLGGCSVALVLGIVLIVVMVGFFKRAITLDPVKVEQAAQEMIEFEAPEGVKGVFAMSMFGLKMAMLMPESGFGAGDMAITLMSLPDSAGSNPEEMQKQMREQLEQQGQGGEVEERLEPEVFTVRGEEITAAVQIQRQATGERVRQYFFFLDGKEKPVMLMLMGDPEGITHEAIQAFLDTVR